MKILIFLLGFVCCSAATTERLEIIYPSEGDKINAMLAVGWTVKHLAANDHYVVLVLQVDSEVLKALDAKVTAEREEEFRRRRETYLQEKRSMKPEAEPKKK